MKKVFFLTGLPRAGNTLFSCLINNNKNIKATANTVLTDVIYQLNMIKDYDMFHNFPDHKSLDNIINKVFINYYKDWKCDYIIDRGPWGTPANLFFLKKIIKKPKFIILYRPVLECLASLIRIERPKDIEARCHVLMQVNNGKQGPGSGILAKYLWSIKHIIKEKEDHILIHYNDLVKDPKTIIQNISKFIKVPLKFNNKLKQFNINGLYYKDEIYGIPLHTIKTNTIEKENYLIEEILPNNIIKQYSNLDI